MQVKKASADLREATKKAFLPLVKTDGTEPEKLKPKLIYHEKTMAVYIVVAKGSQVGHY